MALRRTDNGTGRLANGGTTAQLLATMAACMPHGFVLAELGRGGKEISSLLVPGTTRRCRCGSTETWDVCSVECAEDICY